MCEREGREAPGQVQDELMIRGQTSRVTVSLRELLPTSSFVGCGDVRVRSATDRSERCQPGQLFAAVRGLRHDGLDYVGEALERQAGALLVSQPVATAEVPQCVVGDVRGAYARVCQALAGDPSRLLTLTGITGTNGKTTVSWLLRSIWQAAGHPAGLVGTIEYDDGGHTQIADLTTPAAPELASWLAAMAARGTTHAALELSSHALDQGRAVGVELASAVITNLTQDHFDYHHDWAGYTTAKARIVELVRSGGHVFYNSDDGRVRELLRGANVLASRAEGFVSFGLGDGPESDWRARGVGEAVRGTRFIVEKNGVPRPGLEVSTRLVGRFNVRNCLAAIAVAAEEGIPESSIVAGIGSLSWVPGRLESIHCGQPYDVFVDYAHTDDALRRSLKALRRVVPGRVVCVFGAGGDRDRGKRPLLGAAAGESADVCIITSDNPRSEDPERILSAVAEGVSAVGGEPYVVVDRQEAIGHAIRLARPGDAILVAGKGHETYQEIGGRRLRFDDREVLRATLSGSSRAESIGAER